MFLLLYGKEQEDLNKNYPDSVTILCSFLLLRQIILKTRTERVLQFSQKILEKEKKGVVRT